MQKGVVLDIASLAESDLDLTALTAIMPEWDVYSASEQSQVFERISTASVVVTNKVAIDAEMMARLQNLKLICITATGTNNIDLVAAKKHNIAVSNVVAYATDSVVQHVFALMLAHFTKLQEYTAAVRAGEWSKSKQFCYLDYPINEISQMTLGLVGYGELGKGVEKIAKAFGMKVLVSQRQGGDKADGRIPLDDMLPQCDVISMHVPLAENTFHLIDERRLGLMKPSSLLINTARGAVIDNNALANALRKGVIGGAALDVVDQEPPPEDHVLLADDIPNLVITPHTAWAGHLARQNVVDETVANIVAFQQGEKRNRVE